MVVNVKTDNKIMGMVVYPNPVKENSINILLNNLAKGLYTLHLINNNGQSLFSKNIYHEGGSSSKIIILPFKLTKGLYNLRLVSDEGIRNQKIMAE